MYFTSWLVASSCSRRGIGAIAVGGKPQRERNGGRLRRLTLTRRSREKFHKHTLASSVLSPLLIRWYQSSVSDTQRRICNLRSPRPLAAADEKPDEARVFTSYVPVISRPPPSQNTHTQGLQTCIRLLCVSDGHRQSSSASTPKPVTVQASPTWSPPKKNRKEEIWLEIYPIALIAQSAESDGQIARFGHLNRYTGRTMNAKNSLYLCRRYEKKVGGI